MQRHDLKSAVLALCENKPHSQILTAFAEFFLAEVQRRPWPALPPIIAAGINMEMRPAMPRQAKDLADKFADIVSPIFQNMCRVMRELFDGGPTRPFTDGDRAAIAGEFRDPRSPIIASYRDFLVEQLAVRGYPVRPAAKTHWPDPPAPAFVDFSPGEIMAIFAPALELGRGTTRRIIDEIFA
jgi:hypothetical protein